MNAQQIINESNMEFHAGNYARKLFKLAPANELLQKNFIGPLFPAGAEQADETASSCGLVAPSAGGFNFDINRNTLKREGMKNFAEALIGGLL